jgi:hypothetical protein
MAKIADYGIGFWKGPESKGTTNMINTCKKLNVPLLVYNTETKEILTY